MLFTGLHGWLQKGLSESGPHAVESKAMKPRVKTIIVQKNGVWWIGLLQPKKTLGLPTRQMFSNIITIHGDAMLITSRLRLQIVLTA